jgi:hypothetical protein
MAADKKRQWMQMRGDAATALETDKRQWFGGDGQQTSDACQETSTRDAANKHSLESCASIVLLFLDGCSEWYVSVEFLTGQVLGNWIA